MAMVVLVFKRGLSLHRHFKWIRDTFPSDLSRSLAFLERCTNDLKSNEGLKNDIRFVKMWIEYVSK